MEGGAACGLSSRPRRDGRARWGHAEGGVLTTAPRRDGDRVALVGGERGLWCSARWGSAFLYWSADGVVRGLPPRRHRSPPPLPVRGPWRAEGKGAPPRSPSPPPRPLGRPSCPPPPLARRPPLVTPPRPPPPRRPDRCTPGWPCQRPARGDCGKPVAEVRLVLPLRRMSAAHQCSPPERPQI